MEMDKVPKCGSFVKTRVPSLYIDDVCNYLYDGYDLKRKKHEGISES